MNTQAAFKIRPLQESSGTQSSFRKLSFKGVLVVTGMTFVHPASESAAPKPYYSGSVRHANASLTRAADNIVDIQSTDRMATTPETRIDIVGPGVTNPDLPRAISRIEYLRSLKAGWQGDSARSASRDAVIDATSLLERISLDSPERPLPTIGMDSEGIIVMSWNSGGLLGSLSVFGDGTYSYFIRGEHRSARDGEARISDPLAASLREILMA